MSRARFRWAAVLAGMAAIVQAAPAQAAAPTSSYVLMVIPQQGSAAVRTLTCDPDGGTLEAASQACDQLEAVNGEVGLIPPRPAPCTLEYAPVQVRAQGTWRGSPRYFARIYPNRCVAVRDTGGILFGG